MKKIILLFNSNQLNVSTTNLNPTISGIAAGVTIKPQQNIELRKNSNAKETSSSSIGINISGKNNKNSQQQTTNQVLR